MSEERWPPRRQEVIPLGTRVRVLQSVVFHNKHNEYETGKIETFRTFTKEPCEIEGIIVRRLFRYTGRYQVPYYGGEDVQTRLVARAAYCIYQVAYDLHRTFIEAVDRDIVVI